MTWYAWTVAGCALALGFELGVIFAACFTNDDVEDDGYASEENDQ